MLQREEIERLRFEFLKRSTTYKEYHSWSSVRKNPLKPTPNKIKNGLIRGRYIPGMPLRVLPPVFFDSSRIFFFKDFKEWWKYAEPREKVAEKLNIPKPAEDFKECLFSMIDIVFTRVEKRKGRVPSSEEIKKNLEWIFNDPRRVVLMLSMEEGTPEEMREIIRHIKNRLKQTVKKKRFMKDELERYLLVFDLRESRLKWNDIFLKIHPKEKGCFSENQRRALRADFEKAKKIIKNIEDGKFYWWTQEQ